MTEPRPDDMSFAPYKPRTARGREVDSMLGGGDLLGKLMSLRVASTVFALTVVGLTMAALGVAYVLRPREDEELL